MRTLGLFFITLVLLSGCTSRPPLYYWGNYETVIYQSMTQPQKHSPESQLKLMLRDVEQSKVYKLPLPPGFNAHLGYLYMTINDPGSAYPYFEAEARQFPESRILMDRFLGKKKKVRK